MSEEISQSDNDSIKQEIIYVLTMPSGSHLNPTLCYLNELVSRLNGTKKVIVYTEPQFDKRIQSIPSYNPVHVEVRHYGFENSNLLKVFMDFDTTAGKLFRPFKCFENAFKLTPTLCNKLLNDIDQERPELIIYDMALFSVKLLLNLYQKLYKREKPLNMAYITTFMFVKGIYPNFSEVGLLGMTNSLKNISITIWDFLKYVYVYYKTLLWDLGFSLRESLFKCDWPLATHLLLNDDVNLVFILPELQPHCKSIEKFETVKFLGASIDEDVRNKLDNSLCMKEIYEFVNKSYKNGVNTPINGAKNGSTNGKPMNGLALNGKKLIYVAMGCTFILENGNLFDTLIEACKYFANDYHVVISTGNEKVFNLYSEKYKNLDNILLMPHVPQIEILKYASLFITHAGMNSISEALHYGVPIVCIPLSGDQPLIAWRIANELDMGIRLLANNELNVERVVDAAQKVLANPAYRKRAKELSEISKGYQGHKLAAELTISYLLNGEV